MEISTVSKIRQLKDEQSMIPIPEQLQTEERFQKLQKVRFIKKRRLAADLKTTHSNRKRLKII